MTTDHRREAEKHLARLASHADYLTHDTRAAAAQAHALLAIRDVLEARLPEMPLSSAPAAPVAAQEPDQAPEDPQDATGSQKGSGRTGWLRLEPHHRFRWLVREVEGGWSGRDYDHDHDVPGWTATDYPDAEFTPLLPGSLYVAPDSDGIPAIWRETASVIPVSAMWRTPSNADLFDAVTGLLRTRKES